MNDIEQFRSDLKCLFNDVLWGFQNIFLPAIITVFVVSLITKLCFVFAIVPSQSMFPTINAPAFIIGSRLDYNSKDPERGDIVIFYSHEGEKTVQLVKRVIGAPGDTVECKNNTLFVNGTKIIESYLAEQTKTEDFGPYIVPENEYFVMGDNRNNSIDSRVWKYSYVKREEIIAKMRVNLSFASFFSKEAQ